MLGTVYIPHKGQEEGVVQGPGNEVLLEVAQLVVLLGDGVQVGSHDVVLVLWGVEGP